MALKSTVGWFLFVDDPHGALLHGLDVRLGVFVICNQDETRVISSDNPARE